MQEKVTLHIPKNLFVLYLKSISKITSSIIIKIKNYKMEVLAAGDSSTILVLATLELPKIPANNVTLELPIKDINKLQKICSFADEDELVLTIDDDVIKYKNDNVKLKFFLAEKSIITVPANVTSEKFNNFQITFSTTVSKDRIDDFNRGFDFVKSSSGEIKVYLYIEDNKFIAEFSDKKSSLTDSFKMALSDNYSGSLNNRIPIKHEVWMSTALAKGDIKIEASTVKNRGKIYDILFVKQIIGDLTYSYLLYPLSDNS